MVFFKRTMCNTVPISKAFVLASWPISDVWEVHDNKLNASVEQEGLLKKRT